MESNQLLHSSEYILLCAGFRQWLQTLGYAAISVYNLPRHAGEFLHYLESRRISSVEAITATAASDYIRYLQTVKGVRTGRGYSTAHINKYVQALQLLSRYLRQIGKNNTGFTLSWQQGGRELPTWLTEKEVQQLYDATDNSVLGMRDQSMLAVFYGCGLRLNEGASLEVTDIIDDRRLLYVRRGKGYRERYVPIAAGSYEQLQLYLTSSRPVLLQSGSKKLFIGANKGTALTSQSLYVRIRLLAKKAGITKDIGTHSLRHSIATHLLASGMELEQIQVFLGHQALDSTQLYTHLLNAQL